MSNMNIKQLRVFNGLTQSALADEIGVDRSAVAKWETGKALPRSDHLREHDNAGI